MSEQVERKLLRILDGPIESPYGNPIPGLAELGGVETVPFIQGVRSIVDLTSTAGPQRAEIRRLGEPAQLDPELLTQLRSAGIVPGSTGTFSRSGPYVLVEVDGFTDGLELPSEVASHIFVASA